MKTNNLNFHETFKPERKNLSVLLSELEACSGHSLQEIAQITGIPTGQKSGKVKPTIFYLEFMGLVTKKILESSYYLQYTDLGRRVLEEEPGLSEPLTLMLMHCMLARKTQGAALWSYIITTVLPKYQGRISRENLDKELELAFKRKVRVSPFIGTYTDLLSPLGLLECSNTELYMHPQKFNPEFIFLYGFVLYEYWDEWFDRNKESNPQLSDNEISADQLDETPFRFLFGWNQEEEYYILEALHDRHIIEMNRQMSPFVVRRLYAKGKLVEQLYSELC